MRKPRELIDAETIIALCDRFKKLPSEILDEDASVLRYLAIVNHGRGGE